MRPREELPGRSPIALGQARLTLEFLRDGFPEKKVATYWYEYHINPVKPWPGCYILTPLRDRRPRRSTPGTSPLGHVRVSSASACAMLGDHSGSTPAMHTVPAQLTHAPVKPQGSALIPFCNVPPPRG